MSSQTLAEHASQAFTEQAERTTAELNEAVREHLAEAEHYAAQAATAAKHAAETVTDRVGDTYDAVMEDPATRNAAIGVVVGVAVVGTAVWLWRRRRTSSSSDQADHTDHLYEESADGVPGWNDPAAITPKQAGAGQ